MTDKLDWKHDLALQQRLRELWDTGDSCAKIGKQFGVSKNAIAGAASRLDLPPRPSPIRRDGLKVEIRPRVANPQRYEPLVDLSGGVPLVASLSSCSDGPVGQCVWVHGNPPRFRYCDGPTEPGGVYCAEHARLAYKRKREEAA